MITDEVTAKAVAKYDKHKVGEQETAKGLAAIYAFIAYLSKETEQKVISAAEQSLEEKIPNLLSKEAGSKDLEHLFWESKVKSKDNLVDNDLGEISIQFAQERELKIELAGYLGECIPYNFRYESRVPFDESLAREHYKIVLEKLFALDFNYGSLLTEKDPYVHTLVKKAGDGVIGMGLVCEGYHLKFFFDPSKPASLTEIAEILTGDLCGITLTDKIILDCRIAQCERPSKKSIAYFNKVVEEFNKTSEVQLQLKF
jgi:hypothetical protein